MAATRDEGLPPPPELDESSVHAAKARRSLWHGLISLAILVALVTGLLLTIPGLHGIAHTVTHMQAGWLVLAVGLEVLSCLGYVLAFLQVFDRAPVRFGAEVALSELAFGAAVSLGGAGSAAVGAWLLIDRGGPPRRIAERSGVLFLLTSAVNAITLVLFGLGLFVGVLPGPRQPLLSVLPAAVGVAALAFFLGLPRLTERWTEHRRPGRIRTTLMTTAESIRSTRHLLLSPDWRLLGAIGYLWFDIGVLIACFAAAGKVPPLAPLVLAYQIGFLSNLLPIPGNIGVLDASLVGMLVVYGASATTATAATVVYHAIALWIPAMWGTGAFLAVSRSRGQPLKLRPSREDRRRRRSEGRRQRHGS
ncbi:MAG: lysylphosphatidylglycerol synthase domain-containing protein [Solirubrobacteraceae bacterium]